MALAEALHDVADRTRDQKVLLGEPQAAAGLDVVGGVKDTVDGLDAFALFNGLDKASLGEDLEVELRGRSRVPQPEDANGVGAVARDEDVVGNTEDLTPPGPGGSVLARLLSLGPLDAPAKADRNSTVVALDLPRERVLQPVVRLLHLPTALDALTEHAVVIAKTIAVGRVVEGGQGVEKTGCETAETTVAETGIGLLVDDGVEVEAEQLHGLAGGFLQPGGDQVVGEQAPEQVLHGKVVDHLWLDVVVRPPGEDLAVDHGLADGPSKSHQVVGRTSVPEFETAGVAQVVQKPVAELFWRRLFEVNFGKHNPPVREPTIRRAGKTLTH